MLPPELRVEIRKVGDQYLAVTERANGGEICSNTFTHDPAKLIHIEPQWMLERGACTVADSLRTDAATTERPPDDKLLIDYGQRLYGYLFGDGAALRSFFQLNDAYRSEARLTLRLHPEAAALWSLPWEYLHDGAEFLGLNGRLLVHRMPHGLAELHLLQGAPPLRILVIIASPDDQTELDVERELAVMQEALDELRRAGQVQVDYLDDATLPALQDALSRTPYHVLHFTGHGAFTEKEGKLCFEKPTGQTDLIGPRELRPLLIGQRDLRMIVLSACQSARTSGLDAFDGVATGLLQADLPAVLAMQFSILDDSAIELARVFYTELTRGRTPEEALKQTRLALRYLDETRPTERRRFDWGVPALYVRAPGLRLIDPARPVETLRATSLHRDLGGLTLPKIFVGRRAELRSLRRALREHIPIYVRGIGGIGKTTLIAKLLERPGTDIDDVCVIRCHELSQPVDALNKIASFWQAQGRANHAEAAGRLMSSGQDPAERARQALQLIGNRCYVIVFDNLESWLEKTADSGQPSAVSDAVMREVLRGLLSAHDIRTTLVFTGRYRWVGIETLPPQNRLDVQLPSLTMRQAILLMNALPRLKLAPLSDQLAAFKRVGGHPKTIELLDGWLGTGRSFHALLDDSGLSKMLADEWAAYFLNDLLSRLSPAERDALTTLAILEEAFWWEMARDLLNTPPLRHEGDPLKGAGGWGEGNTQSLLAHLLDLSLIQLQGTDNDGAPFYTLHSVVREYLSYPLCTATRRDMHLRAAAYYGEPFVKAAQQALAESDETWTAERIEAFARNSNGMLGFWVTQTQNVEGARFVMKRALQWWYHLFAASQFEAAYDIVNAVWSVLERWGQRDQAKALLRHSIESVTDNTQRATVQVYLGKLLMDEGHLPEALAIYEWAYQIFAVQSAKSQMATMLHNIGIVFQRMGDYDRAIDALDTSLQIGREIGDEASQAIALHQLTIVYISKADYGSALAHSHEAEALTQKLENEDFLAAILHERGIIFVDLNRPQDAFRCFSESLEISDRIGDESGTADSLGELGGLYRRSNMVHEAIAAYNTSLKIYQQRDSPKTGIILEQLGLVHEQQGEYPSALEKFEQARNIFLRTGHPTETINEYIARVRGKMGGSGN